MYILLAANEAGDELAFGPFADEAAAQGALERLRCVVEVFGPATYRVMPIATLPATSPKGDTVRTPYPVIVQPPVYLHQLYPAWCALCHAYHTHTPAVTWMFSGISNAWSINA